MSSQPWFDDEQYGDRLAEMALTDVGNDIHDNFMTQSSTLAEQGVYYGNYFECSPHEHTSTGPESTRTFDGPGLVQDTRTLYVDSERGSQTESSPPHPGSIEERGTNQSNTGQSNAKSQRRTAR